MSIQGQAVPAGDARATDVLMRISGVTKRYGGVVAIDNLDLSVYAGETLGIIGPNGAGKSTLVGLLGGAVTPTTGTIHLDGRDVTALPAADRARQGIGRTYQIPRPFPDMTVEENLLVAIFSASPSLRYSQARSDCRGILERTGLADAAGRPARALPLLRRKRLEMARALALRPKLLMLDEVGAGLIDSEISELIELIHSLTGEIKSILIVEHVMRVVKECCARLAVLNFGRLLLEGTTAQVLASDDVAAVYLGTKHGAAKGGPAAQAKTEVAPLSQPDPPKDQARAIAQVVATASSAAADTPLVELRDVSAGYGLARVLSGVTLTIKPGQAIAVLGTNGAGKTTLANVLNGTVKPTAGQLLISGQDVTGWPSHRLSKLGLAQCMEGRRIFVELSVEENLRIAARDVPVAIQRERLDIVYGLFPILAERRHGPGMALSGGQQQMLAIGRALMSRPRLIVFDEISLGLAPLIVDQLYATLHELRAAGLTMLIVEQDVDRALDLADHVHVLEQGRIALSGAPQKIRSDPRLRHLYVGEAD
ncbi:MAG TPA: ATP-binding cassette domain-containing protein [Magnetospirillaceae bacterium]|jgi:ABC-type branched-subunit amino acid transport system ATPase component